MLCPEFENGISWNPAISFFRVPTKDVNTVQTGETTLLQLLLCLFKGNLKRQIKNQTFSVELSSRKSDLS